MVSISDSSDRMEYRGIAVHCFEVGMVLFSYDDRIVIDHLIGVFHLDKEHVLLSEIADWKQKTVFLHILVDKHRVFICSCLSVDGQCVD